MEAMTAQFCATVTIILKTTATSQAGCKSRAAHARLNRDGAAAPQRAPRTHHPLRAGVAGCLDLSGSVCGATSRVAAPAQPEGHGSAGRIRPRAGQVVTRGLGDCPADCHRSDRRAHKAFFVTHQYELAHG